MSSSNGLETALDTIGGGILGGVAGSKAGPWGIVAGVVTGLISGYLVATKGQEHVQAWERSSSHIEGALYAGLEIIYLDVWEGSESNAFVQSQGGLLAFFENTAQDDHAFQLYIGSIREHFVSAAVTEILEDIFSRAVKGTGG